MDRPLLAVFLAIVIYAITFMAQVPLLPYLAKQLGAEGDQQYSRLQTIFSAIQFIGGLVSGVFVDRYGGRALLVTSLVASAACYAITASATSMSMLYLSRVPTVLQHAMLAARTIVAAVTTEKDRARYLGYVGVAYGVGFAIGPALGGLASELGLRTTAAGAAVGSLVGALAVLALTPASYGSQQQAGKQRSTRPSLWSGGREALMSALSERDVRRLLLFKTLTALGFALFESANSLILKEEYGLSSKSNGLVLSLLGGVMILTQAFVIDLLRRKFGDRGAMHASTCAMVSAALGIAASRQCWTYVVFMCLLSMGAVLKATIITAQLTLKSKAAGSMIALDMSLASATRIAAPTLSTVLLARGRSQALGLFSASMSGILPALMLLGVVKFDQHPGPDTTKQKEKEL